MSKTDFQSVREGRHHLRNYLSVVAAFVLIAHDSDEEDPAVVSFWQKAEKVVEALQGGEGKTKADQVLAIHEAQSVLTEAAGEFEGDVAKVLNDLAESAGALAQFANDRDFESHQVEKAAEREKAQAQMSAAFASFFDSDEASDLSADEAVASESDEDPDNWK